MRITVIQFLTGVALVVAPTTAHAQKANSPALAPKEHLITQASPQRSALRYQLDAKPLIFRDAPVEPLQG